MRPAVLLTQNDLIFADGQVAFRNGNHAGDPSMKVFVDDFAKRGLLAELALCYMFGVDFKPFVPIGGGADFMLTLADDTRLLLDVKGGKWPNGDLLVADKVYPNGGYTDGVLKEKYDYYVLVRHDPNTNWAYYVGYQTKDFVFQPHHYRPAKPKKKRTSFYLVLEPDLIKTPIDRDLDIVKVEHLG